MLRAALLSLIIAAPLAAQTAAFEELPFQGTTQYHNSTPYTSSGAAFNNQYFPDTGFGEFWSGFAYSKVKDVVTPGYDYTTFAVANGHAAFYKPNNAVPDAPGFGAGAGGSANYAIGYDGSPFGLSPVITLPDNVKLNSVALANSTWSALSIRDGDPPGGFGKKFGGTSGNDADFFKVIITGRDAGNALTGSAELYLADYRFANNSQDYILSQWTTLDLSSLGESTKTLTFSFDSSDFTVDGMGQFLYFNTPLYVAVDNLAMAPIPEPTLLCILVPMLCVGTRVRRERLRASRVPKPRPALRKTLT